MTDASHPPRRSLRERRKNLFMTLTGVFMLLYAGTVFTDILLDANLFWLTAALIVAMTVCAFGWARMLDEAKLSAHYEAWYWGGSLGLLASGLVFLALLPTMMSPGGFENFVPQDLRAITANLAFAAGMMLGMVPAMIGYLIWWGVLWAQRR